MRALLEVIKFEIRYQLRSPFFFGALLLFALIHFMAFTGVINIDIGAWVALADPSARLTVAVETRYWTAAELNANLVWGLLLQNRLLWLMVALAALLLTLLRFRLDLSEQPPFRFRRRTHAQRTPPPAMQTITPVLSFSPRAAFAQFLSQLKMDLACVCKNPLIYIILTLGIVTMIGEFQNHTGLLKTPLYPLTSLMLPALRFGLGQYILLIGLYYSAELIHRERASGLGEIINAAPFPDWLPLLSKTATIFLVVNALMLVVVGASMALQAASGYTHFELGLYLRSAFIHNGFYYCMLCILAVIIQTLSPNKWLGSLVTLGVYIGLLSLEPMGFDHVLYNFNIPFAPYSDMNGYGHFTKPVFALIAYWGAFCVLLLIAGHLLYPRGNYSSVRERLRDARTRLGAGVKLTAGLAAIAFIGIGCAAGSRC
ncbi:MAG: hypothetical protein ACREEM_41245 [Blastocatellia bacterium]